MPGKCSGDYEAVKTPLYLYTVVGTDDDSRGICIITTARNRMQTNKNGNNEIGVMMFALLISTSSVCNPL